MDLGRNHKMAQPQRAFLYPSSVSDVTCLFNFNNNHVTSYCGTEEKHETSSRTATSSESSSSSSSVSSARSFSNTGSFSNLSSSSSLMSSACSSSKTGSSSTLTSTTSTSSTEPQETSFGDANVNCNNTRDVDIDGQASRGGATGVCRENLVHRSTDPVAGGPKTSDVDSRFCDAPQGGSQKAPNPAELSKEGNDTCSGKKSTSSESAPATSKSRPEVIINKPWTSADDSFKTDHLGASESDGDFATDNDSNLPSTGSEDSRRKSKYRKRKRTSYDWLYRDLSMEEEYNIGTVDGDDLEDESAESGNRKPNPKKPAACKPTPEPANPQPAVPQPSPKARVPGHTYTEYHLYQWINNFSDTRRKVRTLSAIVHFEPGQIRISDATMNSEIQDDTERPPAATNSSGPERSHESGDDALGETTLPFKKRKRFLDPKMAASPQEIKGDNQGRRNADGKRDRDDEGDDDVGLPVKKRKRFRNPVTDETTGPAPQQQGGQMHSARDKDGHDRDECSLPFKKRMRFKYPETPTAQNNDFTSQEDSRPCGKARRAGGDGRGCSSTENASVANGVGDANRRSVSKEPQPSTSTWPGPW